MLSEHTEEQKSMDPIKLSHAALVAFFNISKFWKLNEEEEIILLGSPVRSTFFKWKKEKQGDLSKDTLERISYLLGIYKALHILLPSEESANNWPRKSNQAALFQGKSALEIMLNGSIYDLADVRRYLDAERYGD